MQQKVRSERELAHYGRRKHMMEPAFGQVKQGRGLRPPLLQGLWTTRAEGVLWSSIHYLVNLRRS